MAKTKKAVELGFTCGVCSKDAVCTSFVLTETGQIVFMLVCLEEDCADKQVFEFDPFLEAQQLRAQAEKETTTPAATPARKPKRLRAKREPIDLAAAKVSDQEM